MYSDSDIDEAVAGGALSAEAASSLRAFVAGRRATPLVDEENFRLITGFNDIFVAIAIALVLAAIGFLLSRASLSIAGAGIAAVSWGLAEYFTRRRRMALPSILLCLGNAGGAGLLASALLHMDQAGDGATIAGLIAEGAAVAVASYAHWRWFRAPLDIALCAGAVAFAAAAPITMVFPAAPNAAMMLMFVSGLAILALALYWDSSDPARTSHRSDVAFWLHLLAAPLIVRPVFQALGLFQFAALDLVRALLAVAIYLLLAIFAIAIDRRAVLASALSYVRYAVNALLIAAGSLSASVAATALIIGSLLLTLSAFWQTARRAIVARLPMPLAARLPTI
jgi:MFS family permease